MSPPRSKPRHSTPTAKQARHSSATPPKRPSFQNEQDPTFESIKSDLKTAIDKFMSYRYAWDELALGRSLKLAIKIVEIEAEIQSTIENDCFIQKCKQNQVELRDGYAWRQFCKLNQIKSKLDMTLDEMSHLIQRIHALNDQLESLIKRSCHSYGNKQTFEQPISLTWSLPRFCDHLISLSLKYTHSLEFCNVLNGVLNNLSDKPSATSLEKQAVLSYWSCQPLMFDKQELQDLIAIEFPAVT
ncbi:hypothetical protein O181_000373 [Austropuccinia psidii MF-1]|uniref:Uncharacterized protein n=1 Tax=Austropuccinia psidii MF-1 TaxID=1389203 RepID=A0A9Q3GAU3_9BASI|nr:hypothetical protein [Austropuccinia psidii MF-1]